jgi:hypothetical protein
MGLENRPWNDIYLQNILSILFGTDVVKRQELENLLLEAVVPIMKENVDSMKKLITNQTYLQNRKRLAEFAGMDLGIRNKVN